jgi:hypothetical protein
MSSTHQWHHHYGNISMIIINKNASQQLFHFPTTVSTKTTTTTTTNTTAQVPKHKFLKHQLFLYYFFPFSWLLSMKQWWLIPKCCYCLKLMQYYFDRKDHEASITRKTTGRIYFQQPFWQICRDWITCCTWLVNKYDYNIYIYIYIYIYIEYCFNKLLVS